MAVITWACASGVPLGRIASLYFTFMLLLVVCGALGAQAFVCARIPSAKPLFAKVKPYQGWIGTVACVWALVGMILLLLDIRFLGRGFASLLFWFIALAAMVLLLGLGFLLGAALMKTFVKDATARARMEQTVARLSPYQANLGIAAVALGLFWLLWAIISGG